jgi:hypothetical protein
MDLYLDDIEDDKQCSCVKANEKEWLPELRQLLASK